MKQPLLTVSALVLTFASTVYSAVIVLVPLTVPAPTPGAFGSTWKSELWIHNGSSQPLTTTRGVCSPVPPCIGPIAAGQTMPYPFPEDNLTSPVGAIMMVFADELRQTVTFSNRVFELSLHAQPAGVDIPTVWDDQFFSAPVRFLGITSGSATRVSLRVYHPVPFGVGGAVLVEAVKLDGTAIGSKVLWMEYSRTDGHIPGFAAIFDVTAEFPQLTAVDRYDLVVTPLAAGMKFYALASVTDNATQQVLVISTQQ